LTPVLKFYWLVVYPVVHNFVVLIHFNANAYLYYDYSAYVSHLLVSADTFAAVCCNSSLAQHVHRHHNDQICIYEKSQ